MGPRADTSEFLEIAKALREMGYLREGEQFAIGRLGGGVSCDVYRVKVEGRNYCVKRTLPKLRVEADWHAPVGRSHSEVEWIRFVAGLDRRLVPEILGEDRGRHLFVMPFYPPETYPVWKSLLADGKADVEFAASLGEALARIHGVTAGQTDIAARFANQEAFHALRLEPYLLYTAGRHPDVASRLRAIADTVASARVALMHGDFSPKNILCGPDGPLILDAETACYGDPAFDLAFCLNHLALKCVWRPEYREQYGRAFEAFRRAYLADAQWEDAEALDRRAAPLLAALMLARIDGKSPVEYLSGERTRDFVRRSAKTLLLEAGDLRMFLSMWNSRMNADFG